MKEVVISVDAYPRIRNALYAVTQNYPKYPVTILIAGNSDLLKFFSVINEKLFNSELNLEYFDLFQTAPERVTARGLKRIPYILRDIVRERRYMKELYNKHLKRFNDADVYLFNRGYIDFYLARRLRKRNRLVYISSYPTAVTPEQYNPTGLADIVKLVIANLVYGRGIALGRLPHSKGHPHMSDRFLKKEIDAVIPDEKRDEMMNDLDMSRFRVFDVARYSVIYFPQSLIETDYIVDKDTYRREVGEIFGIISKYYPENEIASKYHPGYPEAEKTVVKTGDVLPDYIPAEFLYNDGVKMYLGAFSSAIANVEQGLVVSIMDLISFKSNEMKETIKKILVDMSRSEILFPKSLEEFEKILISIGQKRT